VVEVLAEASLLDGHREVLVRRGHDPDVDRLVAGSAQAADHAVLEDLQELGLERLGEEPDLVEEDRPAVGRLQQPRLGAASIREGAALVAEHLRFQQGVGNCRAVHVHEWSVRAGSSPVDHPGHQPLAGPGFPLDQDRGKPAGLARARKQPRNPLPHRPHTGTVAQQIPERIHVGNLT
jgi:hypothetical protein